MKVKTEYAILAVVVIALGLYLFFRSTDRTTHTLPEMPPVTAQELTKIEIAKADQTVVLTRKDQGWLVSPGAYPADVSRVDRMLDSLADLKITALVSESGNFTRYELDESQEIRVTAFQGDKAVRRFQIGKAAETGRHTHIKLSENPNVYHARGNFRQDFDQSVASLRDKSVLAFDSEAVAKLVIETGDRQITVVKTAAVNPPEGDSPSPDDEAQSAAAPQWTTADGKVLEKEALETLLTALSRLKCQSYLTDQTKADFSDPHYLIRLEGTATSTLEIFKPADDTASEWPARSSLREDPFMLADFDIDPVTDFLSLLDDPAEDATP